MFSIRQVIIFYTYFAIHTSIQKVKGWKYDKIEIRKSRILQKNITFKEIKLLKLFLFYTATAQYLFRKI